MHVKECVDHDGCLVIVSDGWPAQLGSWASHFDDGLAPEARLNADDPKQATIEDRRVGAVKGAKLKRRSPTPAEQERLARK